MTSARCPRMHWFPAWLMLFALLGAGQLLPALHFAFVAHRICAEHGEALHAERPGAGELPASHGAEPGETQVESAPLQAEHEHEHCALAGLAQSGAAALTPAACSAALPAPWEQRVRDAERSAHVDIAVLLYAPKLAPPA